MSFESSIVKILQSEGGYQANAADTGNYNSLSQLVGTNYGISAPVLESYLGRPPLPIDSMNLSVDQAKDIYLNKYWLANNLQDIADPFTAGHILDLFINHGSFQASKIVQMALDSLGFKDYGGSGWGPMTRAEINRVHLLGKSTQLNEMIVKHRTNFYHSLAEKDISQEQFLTGWLSRANKWIPVAAAGSGLAVIALAVGFYYYNR